MLHFSRPYLNYPPHYDPETDNILLINNKALCFRVLEYTIPVMKNVQFNCRDLLSFTETNENCMQSQIIKTFKLNISFIFLSFSRQKGKELWKLKHFFIKSSLTFSLVTSSLSKRKECFPIFLGTPLSRFGYISWSPAMNFSRQHLGSIFSQSKQISI